MAESNKAGWKEWLCVILIVVLVMILRNPKGFIAMLSTMLGGIMSPALIMAIAVIITVAIIAGILWILEENPDALSDVMSSIGDTVGNAGEALGGMANQFMSSLFGPLGIIILVGVATMVGFGIWDRFKSPKAVTAKANQEVN